MSLPHECDSHTAMEGVRYTPFRIPHRRGTARAPQWFPRRLPVLPPTNASLFVSHTAGAPQWLPRRLPVLPPTNASATAYNYQWFWERLPVPSADDYQCSRMQVSVLPPTISSASVDVVVELAVKKRAVRSRSGH